METTANMDISYLRRRQNNVFSRWKLKKRCEIVYRAIKENFNGKEKIEILDIGACDGAALSYLKDRLPESECFGIEPIKDFVLANNDKRINLQSGTGEDLNFPDKSFDVVILSLSLEHISDAQKCLSECKRVLEYGGGLVLLTVQPGYEKFVVGLGIKKTDHYHNFTLAAAEKIVAGVGLSIRESRKLGFPLFYQLTVAEKQNG